jgi:glycerate dehydrogenase
MSKIKIVITDGYPLNPNDLSWKTLQKLGQTTIYDHTTQEQLVARAKDADILIVNKTVVNAATMAALPNLQYIGVTATGYNIVDIEAAKAQGIIVSNAVGYSSPSVAQHTFALILELTNRVGAHSESVHQGAWGKQPHFCYTLSTITELSGKTLGLYGYGGIAKEIAKIAKAFGMKIIVNRRNMPSLRHPAQGGTEGSPPRGLRYVTLENLFKESDILSLNAPLTIENKGLINKENLALMKPTALLINTARGGLVVENDLKEALEKGIIAGAGLDVLQTEPPTEGSVLFGVKNCIITPHNAWASFESRQRLLNITLQNVKAFLRGTPQNVVNM